MPPSGPLLGTKTWVRYRAELEAILEKARWPTEEWTIVGSNLILSINNRADMEVHLHSADKPLLQGGMEELMELARWAEDKRTKSLLMVRESLIRAEDDEGKRRAGDIYEELVLVERA